MTKGANHLLVANVGMTVDEVRKRSTLDIGKGEYSDKGLDGSKENALRDRKFVGVTEFDWEMAGTNLRFPGCKYYWLQTGQDDDQHLTFIHITTAHNQLSWPQLKTELSDIQQRLHADGWKPVQYKEGQTADEVLKEMLEKPKLNTFENDLGGVTYGKGEVALSLLAKRLSMPAEGADPLAANDFIHWIELQPRQVWEQNNLRGDVLPR
jgi:hypothetical protein